VKELAALIAAYRDLRRLLSPLRIIVIGAFLNLLAISVAADLVPQRVWDQTPSGEVSTMLQDALWALLLTPVVTALPHTRRGHSEASPSADCQP
jgi:hypothetical protein